MDSRGTGVLAACYSLERVHCHHIRKNMELMVAIVEG